MELGSQFKCFSKHAHYSRPGLNIMNLKSSLHLWTKPFFFSTLISPDGGPSGTFSLHQIFRMLSNAMCEPYVKHYWCASVLKFHCVVGPYGSHKRKWIIKLIHVGVPSAPTLDIGVCDERIILKFSLTCWTPRLPLMQYAPYRKSARSSTRTRHINKSTKI